MDYIFLKEFFTNYSLPTIIIAAITSLTIILLNLITKGKLPSLIKSFAPFILSFILYFAYDMIFVIRTVCFRYEALYAAFLCSSLSTIIIAAINKIKKGEPLPSSAVVLLVESLLAEYVERDYLAKTATKIELIIEKSDKDINLLVEEVACEIRGASTELNDAQAAFAARIIIEAVYSLKNNKTK